MKFEIGNMRHARSVVCGLLSVVCIMLLSATLCSAAEAYETNYTFAAGSLQGWTNGYSGATLDNPGYYARLNFGSQSLMPKMEIDFVGRAFPTGVVPTQVNFSLRNESMSAGGVWLAFHSAGSGTLWMRTLDPGEAGVWLSFETDVSFSAGWTAGSRTSETNFEADVQNIDWMGVYIQRSGSLSAQSYGLDDFTISGYRTLTPPEAPADSDGDGMTDEWEIANGFDPDDAADAGVDSDGDGMSNFAEYLTGTDPNDSDSVFGVEPGNTNELMGASGFVLEWQSAPDRFYDVMRLDDFDQGFQVIESDIIGEPPKNVYIDSTATNPYSFYKVRVRE